MHPSPSSPSSPSDTQPVSPQHEPNQHEHQQDDPKSRPPGHRLTRKKLRKAGIFLLLVVLAGFGAYRAGWLRFRTDPLGHMSDTSMFASHPFPSSNDTDNDGLDDRSDFLQSAYRYLDTKPRYKSQYFAGGYPDNGTGVCTDVVAQGLLGAGIDLQASMQQDLEEHPEWYPQINIPDPNIDFRRVPNQNIWFSHHLQSLDTSLQDLSAWQPGDIAVFDGHVAIVSPIRNPKGIPFLIHHRSPLQLFYEEDTFEKYAPRLIGHYRLP